MDPAEPEDWRLSFLGRYMEGATFFRAAYTQPSKEWDHDHCMGCWAKFAEPGYPEQVLHEGYNTDDGPWWLCEACFQDFRERFGWKLREEPRPRP
jgi:hypothetical protein